MLWHVIEDKRNDTDATSNYQATIIKPKVSAFTFWDKHTCDFWNNLFTKIQEQ